MHEGFSIAIVGATGAVGREILESLPSRKIPVASLRLLASGSTETQSLVYGDETLPVEPASPKSFHRIHFAFFSAGSAVSLDLVPYALRDGATVIDNSSAFRLKGDVPLVVPEVNAHFLDRGGHLFSNPNCTTIQLVVALNPIEQEFGLERVVVTSFQSVSGSGLEAMEELREQSRVYLTGENLEPRVYPVPIAFNLIPQIGRFDERGFSEEENKVIGETRKILGMEDLRVTATTVRVPVLRGHALSVNLETRKKATPDEVRELLAQAPGCEVVGGDGAGAFPTPRSSERRDGVQVGRIREDPSVPNGLHLWVVADNLRKGAATNALQIAEELFHRRGVPQ
jgi:aspartate-semialdehyde dehydrogenase